MAQFVLNRQNQATSLGEQLLAQGRGQTSTSTGPSNIAGSLLGTAGNAFGNLSSIASLYGLINGGGLGRQPSVSNIDIGSPSSTLPSVYPLSTDNYGSGESYGW